MTREMEIWQTAIALVSEHGSDAAYVATLRADTLLAQYDVDGHLKWKRVRKAVRELRREKPKRGEWVN